jgi:hypothetical protein
MMAATVTEGFQIDDIGSFKSKHFTVCVCEAGAEPSQIAVNKPKYWCVAKNPDQ